MSLEDAWQHWWYLILLFGFINYQFGWWVCWYQERRKSR